MLFTILLTYTVYQDLCKLYICIVYNIIRKGFLFVFVQTGYYLNLL